MTGRFLREVHAVSALAMPVMVAQLSHMGMSLIDTIMAGHIDAVNLAGVALGNGLYWPTMLLLSGLLMAVTPTIAHLRGANRIGETGAVARQAMWIAFMAASIGILLLHQSEPVYRLIDVDQASIPIATQFLNAQSWGLYGALGFYVLRYLCDGMAWTKPAMYVALCALAVKVPLTYALVFDPVGIGGYGGVGCGIATAILAWLQFVAFTFVVFFSRMRRTGVFARFDWPDWAMLGRLARLGIPIGITLFLEVAFFSMITILTGRFGASTLASHHIAMSLGGVAFMVPLALGIATTIRVGAHVGARTFAQARLSARVAVRGALIIGTVSALILFTARHQLVSLYIEDTRVVALAASLLIVAAVFQIVDALQVTAMGALRGYKDTQRPMWIAMFSYWLVGLPLGSVLAFGIGDFAGLGVYGFWWGLVGGLATASCILITRLIRLSRDRERVIRLASRTDTVMDVSDFSSLDRDTRVDSSGSSKAIP